MPAIGPTPREHNPYAALTRHPDPIMREIGAQLRDGQVRPRDILISPAYRNVLRETLERLRRETGTPEVGHG